MPRVKAKARTAKKTAKRVPKKTVAKKATTKRGAAKKTTRKVVKKSTSKVVAKSLTAIKDPMTKSQIFSTIADHTGLAHKQIASVFESLGALCERHLKKRGAGAFTIPNLAKCRVVRKPATKAHKGINPFTGEPTTFKAKPARNVVKVKPLKKMKEMAE